MLISTVSGTAGVGKTAMALHWAHRVADRFPDGQLYVDLHGYSVRQPPLRPADALAGFLTALGVPPEQVPADLAEATALYRSACAGRRLLVLLDNAHSPDQVRPLLPGSTGCLVLVTSRDALHGLVAREGAVALRLGVLDHAEAHDLLRERLGAARVAAEPDAAAELIRACGGLPLALRIAVADLHADPEQSLTQYVKELTTGDRLAALAIDGDEHSAVRLAFDRSYASLDPATQRMFRLFGAFPGTEITVPAAAALADLPPPRNGRLLRQLATAHLLDGRARRYSAHDLLGWYAAELARDREPAADRAAATARVADHYLYAADAAAATIHPAQLRLPLPPERAAAPVPVPRFTGHAEALTWLATERANLVATVRHTAEHGPLRTTWLLADALRGYFRTSRHFADWRAVAEAGLAAARAGGDRQAEAAAELSLADLLQLQQRYEQAIEHYTRSAELSARIGWPQGQAAALGNLGGAYWYVGRLADAARHYRQALTSTGRPAGWPARSPTWAAWETCTWKWAGRSERAGALPGRWRSSKFWAPGAAGRTCSPGSARSATCSAGWTRPRTG